ncbi:aldo/keto reductase [Candidatus Koribacter versatilis Ellin345]|uniref:Aldo/keto reductase n=1 Tax=Koribacter versatilis (strain Ellin345) TaxID=204669 RepID=Q1IQ78_KORVE|nr:aldo/keto reductase [Candidatus Koribacter versatilis]ABF40972.1 aldo/keto reductase [Candidatus Koribacter versatilis Ellin345]
MTSSAPQFLYGTAWKEDRTAECVSLALKAGFRGIDTANQRKHYNEVGVGEALQKAYSDGLVKRDDLFLQTKFTYQRGQDHRLPYDPTAPLAKQVQQSLASSLEHLDTEYVDSFVLHGPASGYEWTADDDAVWNAMRAEREKGRTRVIGVSNVSLGHLQQMADTPAFVQNRCYAQLGWDREIRTFCREHGIVYQGFSLLTANVPVLRHPLVQEIAGHMKAGIAQVTFAFARQIGMLPLTGTTSFEHMQQDLSSLALTLPQEAVEAIESLAG